MSIRRFLVLLCALCFILSSPFSAAYAVDAKSIDELGIDPWGDFEKIQESMFPSAGSETVPPEDTPVDDVPDGLEEDMGVMPLALEPSGPLGAVDVNLYGFNISAVDQDGDDFSLGLRSDANSPVLSYGGNYDVPPAEFSYVTCNGGSGSESGSHASKYNWYLGRPAVLSGDPETTVRTKSFDSFSGSIGVNFPSMGNGASVSAFQFQDLEFYLGSALFLFSSYTGSTGYRFGTTSRDYGVATFAGAQLYINGSLAGSVLTSSEFFAAATSSYPKIFRVEIQNQTVALPQETVVNDFEIRLNFTYSGGSALSLLSNGGFVQTLIFPSSCVYSKNAVIYSEISEESVSVGLLQGIIEWLSNILNSIVELPGKIVSGLIEGIKSLFIPSEEDFADLKDRYQDLLSERLGFVWQAGEWITSFGSELLAALSGGAEAEFKFPGVGFDVAGTHYQLIEEQVVDFGSNGIVVVIRPFIGTIVSIVVVGACVNLFRDMVTALISGKSYFDFLKGDDSA